MHQKYLYFTTIFHANIFLTKCRKKMAKQILFLTTNIQALRQPQKYLFCCIESLLIWAWNFAFIEKYFYFVAAVRSTHRESIVVIQKIQTLIELIGNSDVHYRLWGHWLEGVTDCVVATSAALRGDGNWAVSLYLCFEILALIILSRFGA